MADSKISDLADAGALQSGDRFVIERGAATNKKKSLLGYPELVYRYTVTGSDKASIDTGVDTADAGTNDWTNGDLLEVFLYGRTDDAAALATVGITVNNDGGSNYDIMRANITNTALSAAPSLAQTSWLVSLHGSGGGASYAGQATLVIPDFSGTTLFKSGTLQYGSVDSTAANNRVSIDMVGYRSTSAITRLAVAASAGQKFKVGSQLLIYKRIAA